MICYQAEQQNTLYGLGNAKLVQGYMISSCSIDAN